MPFAVGGVINDDSIHSLKIKAVTGSANNELKEAVHADVLNNKGILYAPDYIVNSGGMIQVADELYGTNQEKVLAQTKSIYDSLMEI
uniref:hypothetical protein n=1 Tax=Peribacillus sedimenti TaxID=3115297 RepID=UPI003F54C904